MKIYIQKSLLRGFGLGLVLSFVAVAAAWAGYTGPNRTTEREVRNPDGDQWYCDRAGFPRCWFAPGNPCPDAGGSHPSVGAQQGCFGGLPADSCGCREDTTTQTTNLPPATVSGSESCDSPGSNGWCRGGASLELSANEPLSGEVIEMIEGNPGGTLCDPADASSVNCSYSVGGDGNFTIEFWAVSSYGDTSNKGSGSINVDSTPPGVSLAFSGGTTGGGGWYRGGSIQVGVSGSDATSGVASTAVSIDGGAWTSSASVSGDGIHNVSGRAIDVAGNQATQSAEVKIDGAGPSIRENLAGTKGRDGWYISPVSVSASASDSLSGVARVEVSYGSAGWQSGPVVIDVDGTHKPRFRAEDVAGNVTTSDGPTIKIDTHPPQSAFINPPEGSETWVSGEIPLIGQSSDITSGLLGVEISFDEGATWEALARAGGDWRTTWDSTGLPNGSYIILVRALDIAGNIESTAQITLLVDNLAPIVDISEEWVVDESGALSVEETGIGLGGAEIIIRDGESVLHTEDYAADAIPESVWWDGLLPGGAVAPPGEYAVVAIAWDLVGNQGSDAGRIIVPEPDPEPFVLAPILQPPAAQAGPSRPGASVLETDASDSAEGVPVIRGHPWIWPTIAWIGLLTSVALAKLSDPRVRAIRDLRDDLTMIQKALKE